MKRARRCVLALVLGCLWAAFGLRGAQAAPTRAAVVTAGPVDPAGGSSSRARGQRNRKKTGSGSASTGSKASPHFHKIPSGLQRRPQRQGPPSANLPDVPASPAGSAKRGNIATHQNGPARAARPATPFQQARQAAPASPAPPGRGAAAGAGPQPLKPPIVVRRRGMGRALQNQLVTPRRNLAPPPPAALQRQPNSPGPVQQQAAVRKPAPSPRADGAVAAGGADAAQPPAKPPRPQGAARAALVQAAQQARGPAQVPRAVQRAGADRVPARLARTRPNAPLHAAPRAGARGALGAVPYQVQGAPLGEGSFGTAHAVVSQGRPMVLKHAKPQAAVPRGTNVDALMQTPEGRRSVSRELNRQMAIEAKGQHFAYEFGRKLNAPYFPKVHAHSGNQLLMERVDGAPVTRIGANLSAMQAGGLRRPDGSTISITAEERVAVVHHLGKQMMLAANAMEKAGVRHNDLSYNNMMVSRGGTLKVIDFGASISPGMPPDVARRQSSISTRGFRSQARREGSLSEPKDDVFSMGRNMLFLASRSAFGAVTQGNQNPQEVMPQALQGFGLTGAISRLTTNGARADSSISAGQALRDIPFFRGSNPTTVSQGRINEILNAAAGG